MYIETKGKDFRRKNMKKRFLATVMTVAIVASSIVGCGTSNTQSEETQATTKAGEETVATEEVEEAEAPQGDLEPMQFRITWDVESGRGQAIKAIVDNYNAQTDGRPVEVVSGNTKVEDIMTSEAELLQLEYFSATSLGQEGYFYDLTSDFEYVNEFFAPAVMDMVSVDGTLYGVPWLGHTMSIVYNQDLLDQAGVDVAAITSWEAFEEALIAVEENTDAKGFGMVGKQVGDISWMTAMFVNSFGGSLLDEEGKVALGSDASKAGLDYYFNTLGQYGQDGWTEHSGTEVMEAFRTQKIAFELQGPWGVTDIWKLEEENRFEVGTLPLAQIVHEGTPGAAEASVHAIGISTLVEDEEVISDAKEFIKFMVSIEAQEQLMNGEIDEATGNYYPFRVPIRNDLQDSEYFVENPVFLGFIQGFDNPSIEVPVPAWSEIRDRYLTAGFNAIANGNRTIDEVVEELTEQGNKILE